MVGNDLPKHGPEIGSQGEVAAFVEVVGAESRPFAVDFAALHRAAQHKHAVRVAVIGAAIAVFVRGAAELRHGDDDDVVHAVAHVLRESGERLPKVPQ